MCNICIRQYTFWKLVAVVSVLAKIVVIRAHGELEKNGRSETKKASATNKYQHNSAKREKELGW